MLCFIRMKDVQFNKYSINYVPVKNGVGTMWIKQIYLT